jgi:hypothetical protein
MHLKRDLMASFVGDIASLVMAGILRMRYTGSGCRNSSPRDVGNLITVPAADSTLKTLFNGIYRNLLMSS